MRSHLRWSRWVDPSALEDSEVVVEATFVNQKLAPVPLETNSILVVPDDDGAGLCIWVSTQFPWDNQVSVAAALSLEPSRVRVIAPAVGGGFGAKGHTYPEHIVVAARSPIGSGSRWPGRRRGPRICSI